MPKKGVKSRGNGQGSALRISANNYKAIAVIGYNEKGNPIRRCKSGFKTKTEALAYIPQLKNPNNKKKTPINLMEAFQKWQTTVNITASTMACYRSGIAVFERIKYIPMESLGIDDFQECIDKCPHGKRTRQNAKTVLNLIYKWAIPRGILPNMNVASFLKVNAEDTTKPKASFTDAQLETLRSADDRVAHAIYIHCYLGFRPSAFLDLKCEDYHGDYFVGGIKTEAGRNRVSPYLLKSLPTWQISCLRATADISSVLTAKRYPTINIARTSMSAWFALGYRRPARTYILLTPADTLSPHCSKELAVPTRINWSLWDTPHLQCSNIIKMFLWKI